MNWLLSILSGIICAAAGAFAAGYVANSSVEWYRIPSREGASGYFVLFIGLLGLFAGLIIGIIASRLAGAFGKGLGAGLGAVVVAAAIYWVIARALGDVPPTINGEKLELEVEFRAPEGWQPSNKVKGGAGWLYLLSLTDANVQRQTCLGQLAWSGARQEAGRYVIPGHVFLFTSRPKRVVQFTLGGDVVASLLAPLPPHPTKQDEQWSDWLPRVPEDPKIANGFRFRYRVRPLTEFLNELDERSSRRAEARQREFEQLNASSPITAFLEYLDDESGRDGVGQDLRSQAAAKVRERQEELSALLRSNSLDSLTQALLGVQALNGIPSSFVEPLREIPARITAMVRAYRTTFNPEDPDTIAATKIKRCYLLWNQAWDRIAETTNEQPPVAALQELDREASQTPEGVEIKSLSDLATHDLERWSAVKKSQ